jgi:isoleucyl-tRNA synthetase
VLVERSGREGFAVASEPGLTVALETALDEELLREGRVYDLIRAVNQLRKDEGYELTDRIVLTVPEADRDLVESHEDWIARDVLATDLRIGDALHIEKS